MPRSSPCSPAEPGAALTALAIGVLLAVTAGNLAPPGRGWAVALIAAACACGGVALWRHPRAVGWWSAVGALLGLAACALAPRAPAAGAFPARFVATVRDGWVPSTRGWRSRVGLEAVEGGREIGAPREASIVVGGSATLTDLPAPGTRVEGTGELVHRGELRLARPLLAVKSRLLLRSLGRPAGIDVVREAGVAGLQRAAGVDPERIRAAGLAAALCFGRTDGLGAAEIGLLRRSGLAHLLAVSGVNVGLVAGIAWALMLMAGVPPGRRRWALIPVVLCFALIAGGDAPVRRAAVGTVAFVIARQLGRPLAALPAVWAVVAGLLLAEPAALLQPSFQLSAGITLALVRWVRPVQQRLPLPRPVAAALAVTVVAQLASVPLVGGIFGSVAPLGLVANLLAAPFSLLMLVLGGLAAGLAPLAPSLAGLTLDALAVVQTGLDGLAALAAPVAWSFAPPPPWLIAVLLTLALGGLSVSRVAGIAAIALVAVSALWLGLPAAAGGSSYEARLLPVSDGMALLLRGPDGATLVDAGRSPIDAARELSRLRLRRLEALVLTHADEDHVGGAGRVLERMRVATLVVSAPSRGHPAVVALRREAWRRGAREVVVNGGDELRVGGAHWRVLWPGAGTGAESNDSSLVASVELGGRTVLITGDIEAAGERALLASVALPRADLLQVAHHGSRSSSTAAFLARAAPRLALVPLGSRTRAAHPEVALRLRRVPALVLAPGDGPVRWQESGEWASVGATRVRLAP